MPRGFDGWLAVPLLAFGTAAGAQSTLGALLDAGAKRLSPEQFRQEVVQRPLQGPLPIGMNVELMYTPRGAIEGVGAGAGISYAAEWSVQVRGSWQFGSNGSVCTVLVLDGPTIRASYPPRCQYWYSLNDQYYVSDSDSDRGARVHRRTVKG